LNRLRAQIVRPATRNAQTVKRCSALPDAADPVILSPHPWTTTMAAIMYTPLPADAQPFLISTGHLPQPQEVETLIRAAYDRYKDLHDGKIADYIPALAKVSGKLFGICLVGTDGRAFAIGDSQHEFSIQSVSKPFVFALVCEAIGIEVARGKIGVNATGLPFNSVMAIELNADRTMNPMVNAGAIATTSLVPGDDAEAKWRFIHEGLSRFAGRKLELDAEIYASEAASNLRNRGIAKLLEGYDRMYSDALQATDIYTKQCSLKVNAHDLAVMGATLADGGVNPLTQQRVVEADVAKSLLAALATAGLYERSGDWLFEIGLPGKSGVGGGIVTISPGKCGLGVFSPPLDEAGNSVRAQRVTKYLSEHLGLNLFASRPA
jgi:glutaminase